MDPNAVIAFRVLSLVALFAGIIGGLYEENKHVFYIGAFFAVAFFVLQMHC